MELKTPFGTSYKLDTDLMTVKQVMDWQYFYMQVVIQLQAIIEIKLSEISKTIDPTNPSHIND